MFKNAGFFQSLKNAVSGFLYAVKAEKNLRFHIVIANLICLFAYFYKISRPEWAILMITIFSVISAELFNTGIEKAVDTATDKICETAKRSKDTSAAATLVLAVMALAVGICLFGDITKIKAALISLFGFAFSGPLQFLALALILIFDIWLLVFCGREKG